MRAAKAVLQEQVAGLSKRVLELEEAAGRARKERAVMVADQAAAAQELRDCGSRCEEVCVWGGVTEGLREQV